jgi:Z1 domain-containing protein
MPVVTDGPIFTGFKSAFPPDRPLAPDTEECSASVIRLLEHHQTTALRPGMLLGKVQSGKTRAFVGAIAIAFDSGFDIAIVLTKTSTPLAIQTIRRLQHDLEPAISDHRVRVFDAAERIGPLNEWLQSRKLIFVAKKHPKNLENLHRILLVDHPALRDKRVIVIDDEADFASVGYERRLGNIQVRTVQTLINDLREGLPNVVYLEVTATPYSLYLQPADIQEPATGQAFQPVRPAFTKRVPIHPQYIGGEFYFDEAQQSGSMASFVHIPVSDAELAAMRQPGALAPADLLTAPEVQSLRRSLITFIVGGVIRQTDEAGSGRPERLFSFIVHLERLRGAHADQQGLARRLIDQLRGANLAVGQVADQVQAAYDDLVASRQAAQMATPPLADLLPVISSAFKSISTEVVNSDTQLRDLLDPNTGQLRQQSPFNIYIGGQSLDRGVTIANVIGFFYGRDPQIAQQDTTIQHCRMYGDRPRGDLAVTRFYTSNGIYARMRRMHEFDQMLWEQLRQRDENGDEIDDPGDVVFLQRDPSGQISPCSPNKIILTRAQWTRPGGELVPSPFTTISERADAVEAQQVLVRLRALSEPSVPFDLTVDQACDLLDAVCSLIRIDDGWDWDLDALKDAVRHLASTHEDETQRNRVVCLYTLNNTIRKWKDPAHLDPQRAPYSAPTEAAVRHAAGDSPALAFYHNVGNTGQDWQGSPFVWPVLFVPDSVVPTVFANNRRNAPRRRRSR